MTERPDIRIFELEAHPLQVTNQRYGTYSDFTDPLLSQLVAQHCDYMVEEFPGDEIGGWFSITDQSTKTQHTLVFERAGNRYQQLAEWIRKNHHKDELIIVACVEVVKVAVFE